MQGQLFSQDFLLHGVRETPAWQALDAAAAAAFDAELRRVFAGLDAGSVLNEAQTEQVVIEGVLRALGWGDDYLPQVNLSGVRRDDVPDILLFADAAARARALDERRDDRRYRHGVAILEAKRWLRPLDRGDASEVRDPDAPSSQMLRYLSRAEVMSDRAVKWGLLTNGGTWRLYWQDARSRAEEFFELDLAALLGVAGTQPAPDGPEPAHGLKLFRLLFGRSAFLPQPWDEARRSLHAFARSEARRYEERVSGDLGRRVFDDIFPRLAQALAAGDLHARREDVGYGQFARRRYAAEYLDEVREAALILLYRLLFLFYAEDRLLLPAHDARYAPYSVRRLREHVRDAVEARQVFSTRLDNIWRDLRGAFELINVGDDAVGMPAYNGGLFDRARAPLLERTRVPDAVMAPIIDQLSRRTEEAARGWINYRDLSVAHLGGIYERLLEYALVHEVQAADDYRGLAEIDRIVARPASFARKVSGSYYTHDDLVRLILRESVGRLAGERADAFDALLERWRRRASLTPPQWDALDRADPAGALLDLKVCDPAMGSGHFLVALVDDLADRVLEAVNAAQQQVAAQPWAAHLAEQGRPWQSPVVARIAHIRRGIRGAAQAHGWAVTEAQLDDRHIVRRMILKKVVYGVDKNPMAVELAKTALWLHTFTVGAPLSFLDHHLKRGDSLHGERLDAVQRGLQALGMLFQQGELERLEHAARNLAQVAELTDIDIAEARLSKRLADEADAQVAPLHALLDLWRALRWLAPGWPVDAPRRLAKLGDAALRDGLLELLSEQRNLVAAVHAGRLDGAPAASALLERARALAARETFFHWWSAFPTVFGAGAGGGFDAVIGNPPWDRIKLQEVEWFAERDRHIAEQPRAADRKRLVAEQQKKGTPLAAQYAQAVERAEANARVLARGGDYPLLGGGDVNLYSLFVERAQALVKPQGIVALLTPSGIAADKGAAPFFSSLVAGGRLGAVYDFENKGVFFPDVHKSFKFCVFVFGGERRRYASSACAFFLTRLGELDDAERVLALTPEDFALVNPNTAAAPVFRSRRDAELTLRLYRRHPVLVRHGGCDRALGRQPDECAWPVRYATMFHMTSDSALFMTRDELQAQGWQPAALGRWRKGPDEALPLYEGKMVQMYDHRAADVVVNSGNLQRAAQPRPIDAALKAHHERLPEPQYWVDARNIGLPPAVGYSVAFKDVTSPTNSRTMIAALVPRAAYGNTLPVLLPESSVPLTQSARSAALLLANLACLALDYVARQKVQGQHLNWFVVEQLPVIAPARFDDPLPPRFVERMRALGLMNGGRAQPAVADFVVPQVLALSYTAHDLAAFARDLGYLDAGGNVLAPIVWNDAERRARMAALDALFMWLYGLDEDDAGYVLDSFPIVRAQDEAACGRFRTRDEILDALRLLR